MRRAHRLLAVPAVLAAVAFGAAGSGAQGAPTRQLVIVVTPTWDSTAGVMRRYARASAAAPWRLDGPEVPIVVGRAGLAWGADSLGGAGDPHKREGDGRAPAGIFPLDTAFGFAPAPAAAWVRLPYVQLTAGSECVDDTASVHYNQVVDRGALPSVDWTSAERMRQIGQYEMGVIVGYNTQPPRRGRGSCIFLHIWAGPGSSTAGCTAFPRDEVEALLRWLDPSSRPTLVQLTAADYARLRTRWSLP
jgi:D-alanyl-D-alanine dipeptidase